MGWYAYTTNCYSETFGCKIRIYDGFRWREFTFYTLTRYLGPVQFHPLVTGQPIPLGSCAFHTTVIQRWCRPSTRLNLTNMRSVCVWETVALIWPLIANHSIIYGDVPIQPLSHTKYTEASERFACKLEVCMYKADEILGKCYNSYSLEIGKPDRRRINGLYSWCSYVW